MPGNLSRKYIHPDHLTPHQQQALDNVGAEFEMMERVITAWVPRGREQSLVLTKLEEALMWANRGICHPANAVEHTSGEQRGSGTIAAPSAGPAFPLLHVHRDPGAIDIDGVRYGAEAAFRLCLHLQAATESLLSTEDREHIRQQTIIE